MVQFRPCRSSEVSSLLSRKMAEQEGRGGMCLSRPSAAEWQGSTALDAWYEAACMRVRRGCVAGWVRGSALEFSRGSAVLPVT
jgi:hypothetical protein